MGNQIKNQEVTVESGTKMNDKDYMNSLLGTLKELTKNYALILTEASNEKLYEEYKQAFEVFSHLQREIYELMFQKGWYVIEKSDVSKILTEKQKLSAELTKLNG